MKILRRFLIRMILFLVAVAAVAVLLFPALERVFLHNVPLNSMILGAAVIGIIYMFRRVLQLGPELAWIEDFRSDRQALSRPAPRLLGPMATVFRERKMTSLSTIAMRTLLDSISARLDESRDISHYLIGLMIFLGLLGTFWGLLETVNSVGGVIASLEIGSRDVTSIFNNLKTGLERPLSGMGTSFSSSLFGLASSLVLGFLDLQASQAQNLFYQDLEEWLSGLTRLTSGSIMGEGEASVPAYIEALLEKTADSLDGLQRLVGASEENRAAANSQFIALNDRLAGLADLMRGQQGILTRFVDGQRDLGPVLSRLAEQAGQGAFDDATRAHIRNLDVYMGRLVGANEESRGAANTQFIALNDRLAVLADLMRTEQALLSRFADGQRELAPLLNRLSDSVGQGGFDEATRAHIRNLDVYMGRLVEEMSMGRQRTVDELRAEIRLLARTIANLAEEAGP